MIRIFGIRKGPPCILFSILENACWDGVRLSGNHAWYNAFAWGLVLHSPYRSSISTYSFVVKLNGKFLFLKELSGFKKICDKYQKNYYIQWFTVKFINNLEIQKLERSCAWLTLTIMKPSNIQWGLARRSQKCIEIHGNPFHFSRKHDIT